jgi:hypothetical protein
MANIFQSAEQNGAALEQFGGKLASRPSPVIEWLSAGLFKEPRGD